MPRGIHMCFPRQSLTQHWLAVALPCTISMPNRFWLQLGTAVCLSRSGCRRSRPHATAQPTSRQKSTSSSVLGREAACCYAAVCYGRCHHLCDQAASLPTQGQHASELTTAARREDACRLRSQHTAWPRRPGALRCAVRLTRHDWCLVIGVSAPRDRRHSLRGCLCSTLTQTCGHGALPGPTAAAAAETRVRTSAGVVGTSRQATVGGSPAHGVHTSARYCMTLSTCSTYAEDLLEWPPGAGSAPQLNGHAPCGAQRPSHPRRHSLVGGSTL